ncbi:MAG: beta-CASP ribonuclease aCPSF1 [Candidatus Micrarchaeota archaeon]
MHYKDIAKKVEELMPKTCGVTKVEPEGLAIVIYIKDVNAFYNNTSLIKELANSIKKKVLIRVDPKHLVTIDLAKAEIEKLIPAEAGVKKITFVPEMSEVRIEAIKSGLVIGKGGSLLKEIMTRTGWAPIVLRAPTMPSVTLEGVRRINAEGAEERKKFLTDIGKKICHPPPSSDWIRAVTLGGFNEVGRSCLLVQTPHSKVLIDVGVNTATNDPTRAYPYLNMLGFSLSELDAVVISHSHMDHMGFLPYLYAYGYEGPVYCTAPTRDTMVLLQQDYINLCKGAFGVEPVYTKKDIQKELKKTITVDYGEVVDITPEMKMTLYNAGHILGSASVHLHIGEGAHNLVYSGDIKFGFTRLFDPATTKFPRVETLFVESTYGGRNDITINRFDSEKRLMDIIMQTLEKRGKVLIPVFAVGRSQEILLVLEEFSRRHPEFNVPIYIDGMILEASAIHTAYPEFMREQVQRRVLSDRSPFESPLIKVAKGVDRSSIATDGEPAVILAPSGMLAGGPSLEYLKMMSDEARNTLIFVGYQSALSLGYKIQSGSKEVPTIGDDGRTKLMKINMRVETAEGFSGHSDRAQLMAYVRNLRPTPERIITMHGDLGKTEDFSRSAGMMLRKESWAMANLEAVRLR